MLSRAMNRTSLEFALAGRINEMAVATADEAPLAERFAFLVIDHPVRVPV
jgi:hypothetical protein